MLTTLSAGELPVYEQYSNKSIIMFACHLKEIQKGIPIKVLINKQKQLAVCNNGLKIIFGK